MKKKIFWLVVILLTIIGTLGGRSGGFVPFNNVKSGDSYGINFSLLNEFDEGSTHYGINLSLMSEQEEDSKIVGLNLSILRTNAKKENSGGDVEGVEIGAINISSFKFGETPHRKVKGLQIGIHNSSVEGPLQIGVYNAIFNPGIGWRESLLINF